jgi:hypothetical protein
MKNYTVILVSLASVIPFSVQAQQVDERPEELAAVRALNQDVSGTNTILSFDSSDKSVIGHPFLFDVWSLSTVVTTAGRKYEKAPVRLDLVNYRFQYKPEGGQAIELDSEQIASVSMPGKEGNMSTFKSRAIDGNPVIVEVIFDKSDAAAYRLMRKTLLKGRSSNDGYTTSTRSRYELQEETWLQINGVQKKVKRTAGSVSAAFGSSSNEIKAFIKKEKISVKSDTGLARVMEYYSSMRSMN